MKRKNFDEIFMQQFDFFVHKEQKKLVTKLVNTFGLKFSKKYGFRQKNSDSREEIYG